MNSRPDPGLSWAGGALGPAVGDVFSDFEVAHVALGDFGKAEAVVGVAARFLGCCFSDVTLRF